MKIKIELGGLTLEHATEITTFLKSLSDKNKIVTSVNGSDLEVQIDSVKEEKPKLTRKKSEKVEVPQEELSHDTQMDKFSKIAEAHEQPQEETKAEAIEVKEPETGSAPTLMQIRSLVAQKAGAHKDSIKSKLDELGAQNVSTLDAKHFQTIFDFLTEL